MITTSPFGTFTEETTKRPLADASSEVIHKAKQAARKISGKAEDATYAVGGKMKSFADTIRDKGPQEGMMAGFTQSVASNLESGGDYLQRKGLNGIAREATNLMRRNPLPTLLVGLGLGCVLARLTTRS